MVVVLLSLILFLNALWWFLADRLIRRHSDRWQVRVWPLLMAGGMGGLLILYIASRLGGLTVFLLLPYPVTIALYLWHMLVMPVSLIAGVLMAAAGLIKRRLGQHRLAETETGLSRRQMLVRLVPLAPAVSLAGLSVAAMAQLEQFRIRQLVLPVPGLPSALRGLTIAQVSDAHVGPFTFGRTLDEIVRATNQLQADLVLLTGDLINSSLADLPEAVEMVRALDSRYGVFLCEGNHDLIPGPGRFEKEVRSAGLNLLVNERTMLEIRGEAVQLLGLRWGGGRSQVSHYSDGAIVDSLRELLELRDPDVFPILMAHHPHAFDPAAEAGIPLVLSGHTHGGQLMVNEDFGFGPAIFRYWTGVYTKPRSVMAVSNGVGNWFPLRTAAPAEILHITLQSIT